MTVSLHAIFFIGIFCFIVIEIIASPTCISVAIPFICQSVFPLCNQSNKTVLLATEEECQYVSVHACPLEWEYAQSLSVSLPVCDNLPNQQYPISKLFDSSYECIDHESYDIDLFLDTSRILPDNASNLLSCNEQFYENNGTCIPNCYEFKQASKQTSSVVKGFEIATGWFALIMCVIVFIISGKRYKVMLVNANMIIEYSLMFFFTD